METPFALTRDTALRELHTESWALTNILEFWGGGGGGGGVCCRVALAVPHQIAFNRFNLLHCSVPDPKCLIFYACVHSRSKN